MKKLFNLFALTLFCCLTVVTAQAQRTCAAHDVLQQQILADPARGLRLDQIEQFTQHVIANTPAGQRAVITIPVVFHIVYRNATENVSDAQVQSQLDAMNADFRALNADISQTPSVFAPLIADCEIQFCMAQRTPDDQPTNGIHRVASTRTTDFGTNDAVKSAGQGGTAAWDATRYMNIWVCSIGSGILGYAQFPGGNNATDGVVCDYNYFGTIGTATAPYDLGRTLTHEIGHWLNLRHIWGDANCGNDQVADTPTQQTSNGGCPNFPQVTCNNGPNGDLHMNYMDYTNDACMYMFSLGQKDRMLALFTPGGDRESLLTSNACSPIVVTDPPIAAFTQSVTSTCTGDVFFTDATTQYPSTWFWDFGDGNTSTGTDPNHTYTVAGTYNVMMVATNIIGSDTAYSTVVYGPLTDVPAISGNTTICAGETTTLTATGAAGHTFDWTDGNGNSLFTGASFTTPALSTTTTYSVYEQEDPPVQNVGPADNTIGNGGNHNTNFEGRILFTAYQPFLLKSVYVYAQGAANRTINLYDATGATIQTVVVNVPNGGSRITLNMAIPAAGDYEIGNAAENLYRNSGGVSYPYTLNGIVSLTNSNATQNPGSRYYYFYDWEVSALPCQSAPVQVTVDVTPSPTASFTSAVNGFDATFTNNSSVGASYVWNFGDGSSTSTASAPSHTYAATGTYTVTLTVTNGNCSSSATQTVTIVDPTGINTINTALDVNVTPNPAYDWVNIQLASGTAQEMEIVVFTADGRRKESTLAIGNTRLDFSTYPAGMYMIEIRTAQGTAMKKIIKN